MRIGVPTEIKTDEYRVGMTPAGAAVLHADGHEVFVQAGAGNGSGFSDDEYKAAGATILPSADSVYEKAEMIVKVKEPIEADLKRLKDGQLLFTYLHLAPVPELTQALLKKKITGVAYETITDDRKRTDVGSRRPHVSARRSLLPAQTERRPGCVVGRRPRGFTE